MSTSKALPGPALETVMVDVRLLLMTTMLVAKTWVKARSESGRLTVVMAETVLLAEFRSISLAETLAVLVKRPAAAAPGTTTTVTVAAAPAAKGPRFPVTAVALVRTAPR